MLASPVIPSFLDTYNLCHLSDVKACALSSTFLFFGPFVEVLVFIFKMIPSILQGDCPGVYFFDEIPAAEFGFEKLSRSPKVFFTNFFTFLSAYLKL